MNRYLIDTNVIIKSLQGNPACIEIIQGSKVYLSIVTEIELKVWDELQKKDDVIIDGFLSQCFVHNFYLSLKPAIIFFRKKYKLKLPDAIIVATAYDNGLPLVSSEKKFQKIIDLPIIYIE